MVGIMPLLRRSVGIQNITLGLLPVSPITGRKNSEKEATLTKQANYFRGKIFSREDIFAGRYFRVNSIFAKISSRENISN